MKFSDGVLTLHQSDINNYMNCPEQFRVVHGLGGGRMPDADPDPIRVETDAATIGTTLHEVIERDISDPYKSVAGAKKSGRAILGNLVSGYITSGVEYRTESYGDDPAAALRALDQLVESWMMSEEREYWLQREPGSFALEQSFEVPFLLNRSGGRIWAVNLAGTMDLLDFQENRVVDWKSGGREYQRWEKQRWALQPTVYTYAAAVV